MLRIEGKETVHFEAKLARGGLPRSLWETYSAFANSDGGEILLGIEERPDKTLREALVNCLVNADYDLPRGVVVVRNRDGWALSNPGGFRVPIATAMSGGISDPRNATLLKMFSLIDIGERSGHGIPMIDASWKAQDWPAIECREEFAPERTTIILMMPERVKHRGKAAIKKRR